MNKLLAWHNDPELRERTIAEMRGHREADRLVKGHYWEGGKGCAVGCMVKGSDHSLYEPRFGIPQALARLEDAIFENLPDADAMLWPERFLAAARVGSDQSLVQWQFLAFVVDEALSRPAAASVREACLPALEIVRARARGEAVTMSEAWSSAGSSARSAANAAWSAAESSAWSAAWSAAESSAWSAANAARSAASSARSAAWSEAWSEVWSEAESSAWSAAESAAESSAWSEAWSAAESSARSAANAAWKRYADKLIDLMEAA